MSLMQIDSIRLRRDRNRLTVCKWFVSGELLSSEDAVIAYKVSYYRIHCHDLNVALLDAAKRAGVTIHTKQRVLSYDFDAHSATMEAGKTRMLDLIVCADGIKSIASPLLTGQPDIPTMRIVQVGSSAWCGLAAHLVGCPTHNRKLYKIVVCAASYKKTTDEFWVIKCNNKELHKRFES
ncbi:hypothetical protein TMatcc_009441 [Talaromyces marneffei ATCC 18224]